MADSIVKRERNAIRESVRELTDEELAYWMRTIWAEIKEFEKQVNAANEVLRLRQEEYRLYENEETRRRPPKWKAKIPEKPVKKRRAKPVKSKKKGGKK